MEYKTFSCFINFVPSGSCGTPEHTPMHNALYHLEKLLQNLSEKIKNLSTSDLMNKFAAAKMDVIKNERMVIITKQTTFNMHHKCF